MYTPIFEYFSTKSPNAPRLVDPKLLESRTSISKTLETKPSSVFRPISKLVMVPIRAPSNAASASSAELRMDNVPTYDSLDTSRASLSGNIVAPALSMSAFDAAFEFATEMTCDCPAPDSDGIFPASKTRLASFSWSQVVIRVEKGEMQSSVDVVVDVEEFRR